MMVSSVVVTTLFSRRPSMLMAQPPENCGTAAFHRLLPFQRPFHPLVDKANHKDGQEDHHGNKTKGTDFLEHDRPGEEKGYFEIEQNEQNGNEVIAHIELHARIFKGLETAFVCGKLFTVRPIG